MSNEKKILKNCSFFFQVTRASIDSFDSEAATLLSEPLRFGFVDGRVTEVCASEKETPKDLNVKRGILSAFQNSFDGKYERKEEEEVSGIFIQGVSFEM